ncbi:MAG: nucleotidyltransferase family protein [Pseudomonadota bacterium]
MTNHFLALQRLARLSDNDTEELDDAFAQFLIDELEQPISAVGRLSPLLLRRVQHLDRQPAELLRRLQFAAPIAKKLHRLQQQWLGTIVQALIAEKIAVAPLKAAAFNDRLYPADTPRVGADLDLLIKEQDAARAHHCLARIATPVDLTQNRHTVQDAPCNSAWKLPQQIPGTLYLHQALTPAELFPLRTGELFERSMPYADARNALLRKLSVEDHLLQLAIQGTCDLSVINHNLLDAHEIWRQWQPDRYKLLKSARQAGASNALFILLETCRRELGTPVPESWLQRLPQSHLRASFGRMVFETGALHDRNAITAGHRVRQLLGHTLVPDTPGRITTAARYCLKPAPC